jgi:hypothetical protein
MDKYNQIFLFMVGMLLLSYTCRSENASAPDLSQIPQNEDQSCSLNYDTGVSYDTDNLQQDSSSNF